MICPTCLSVFFRRTTPINRMGDAAWTMAMACGGCGGEFSVMISRTGTGMTDREANEHARAMRNGEKLPAETGEKSMVGNGGNGGGK